MLWRITEVAVYRKDGPISDHELPRVQSSFVVRAGSSTYAGSWIRGLHSQPVLTLSLKLCLPFDDHFVSTVSSLT